MNSKTKVGRDRRSVADAWRDVFRRRRRMHDPMLVFNMSIFNFGGGWERILNPLKIRENAG
jgi:hypothetical protein